MTRGCCRLRLCAPRASAPGGMVMISVACVSFPTFQYKLEPYGDPILSCTKPFHKDSNRYQTLDVPYEDLCCFRYNFRHMSLITTIRSAFPLCVFSLLITVILWTFVEEGHWRGGLIVEHVPQMSSHQNDLPASVGKVDTFFHCFLTMSPNHHLETDICGVCSTN